MVMGKNVPPLTVQSFAMTMHSCLRHHGCHAACMPPIACRVAGTPRQRHDSLRNLPVDGTYSCHNATGWNRLWVQTVARK